MKKLSVIFIFLLVLSWCNNKSTEFTQTKNTNNEIQNKKDIEENIKEMKVEAQKNKKVENLETIKSWDWIIQIDINKQSKTWENIEIQWKIKIENWKVTFIRIVPKNTKLRELNIYLMEKLEWKSIKGLKIEKINWLESYIEELNIFIQNIES